MTLHSDDTPTYSANNADIVESASTGAQATYYEVNKLFYAKGYFDSNFQTFEKNGKILIL